MRLDSKYLFLFAILFFFLGCGGGSDDSPMPPDEDDDDNGFELDLSNCPLNVSNTTLEIFTWNIENFPKNTMTSDIVQDVINQYDLDIIAVQEITSTSAFNTLVSELEGWEGTVVRYNGSNLMLGYLYKSSEVTVNGTAVQLYEEDNEDNNFAFTSFRRPLMLNITHTPSGLKTYLINIHLKCCTGDEDRRRAATSLLKTYVDTELPNDNVVILGDYNDDIVDSDNVFQEWIDDPDNYYFTTMSVAQGPDTEWSYPNWPSQIDNILITNELFDNEVASTVQALDRCFGDFETYDALVSDHRPAYLSLRGN